MISLGFGAIDMFRSAAARIGHRLLQEALIRGEFDRGEAERITQLPERSARRVLKQLIDEGLLASDTPKRPVSLRFPSDTLETLFPRLYV